MYDDIRYLLVVVLSFFMLGACADDTLRQIPTPPAPPLEEEPPPPDQIPPVAVIAPPAATNVSTPTTLILDGTGSYDSDGQIVEYRWSLESAPNANASTPTPMGTGKAEIIAALVGSYTIGLVVVDNDGLTSQKETVTFNATPNEAIHVELTWDYAENDVDLHLIAPGGAFGDFFLDCHYGNCTPEINSGFFSLVDWGVYGDASDNPSLDIDNINDIVPENINLDNPASGEYKVVVNYYYQGDTGAGAAHPEVRIYLNGVLHGPFGPVTLNSGCDKWTVATISIPGGTVTPDGTLWRSTEDCEP